MSFENLNSRTRQGGSDEEILGWRFARGRKPDAEQIEVWNAFRSNRGWRDSGTPGYEKAKIDAGLADRDELLTIFNLMDAEKGRT